MSVYTSVLIKPGRIRVSGSSGSVILTRFQPCYYYYYQFYQEGRHTQKAKPVQGASPIVNYTINKTKKQRHIQKQLINYITIKDKTITNMR